MINSKVKILVTGGCGFIGSHIVDALILKGFEVVVLDNFSTGSRKNLNSRAKFYNVDIINYSKINRLFEGVNYVFHTAALARIQPSIKNPADTFNSNAVGTFNVLLAAKEAGVARVIYCASSSVYGDQNKLPLDEEMVPRPKSMYALSKLMGEDMCKVFSSLYGLQTVSLRYFNVYGPRHLESGAYSTVVGIFLKQQRDGLPLTITGDGSIKRDFTYISDVVEANLLAMTSKKVGKGEIINIGFGENFSINQVADIILGYPFLKHKNALRQKKIIYLPPRPAESKATLAKITKAKNLLGWVPKVSFVQGVGLTKKEQIK
ncbi:NAD-dependent epimerase/dehydratase family protein [Candidatus Giovannonibacteria bacterium]|nr:NAD-dependent epimerase/dehydratase family protein [Candidatus Giovannonibacteria bacterium]